MTFANQIETIISKRHEQAKILEGVMEKWESLRTELEKLETERKQHLEKISDTQSKSDSRLQDIDLSDWIKKIKQKIEELKNLKTKLSRKTLNIGVVGRMRQGKSQLLQSITGLTDAEIPTSSGGVCTRILSKVFHEPSGTRNEVQFHSPDSLLEIIHQYYDHLGLPADSKPKSIDDFISIEPENFPKLSGEYREDPNNSFLYGRLRGGYYSNYDQYKNLLTDSTNVIPPAEIINYVTDNQNSNGQVNRKYLAVKELRIFGNFPDGDEFGKIGVVDLPGLGDDDVSDTELLIKTLKQDVDFILFVRKPNPIGDNWQEADRKMYGLAKQALNGFPLEKCSFMVLNKDKDKPIKSKEDCNRFRDEIESQGLEVSQVVIANCTKSSDVKQEVMTPAILNLTQNISLVYEQYLRFHNQELKTFKGEIEEKLKEATNALEGIKKSGDKGATHWFKNEVWKNLTDKMFDERNELSNKQHENDSEFEKQVTEVVDHCLNGNIIPEKSQIRGLSTRYGDSYKIAYYMCINEVRMNLTSEFKVLAKALEESERKLQYSVAKILHEQGKLNNHTSLQGYQLKEETCVAFFDEVKKLLPENTEKLEQALRGIKKRTDTYEDTIMGWIQPHLDTLRPDKHLDPISKEDFFANEVEVNELKETVSNMSEEEVGELDGKMQELQNKIQSEALSEISQFISSIITLPFPVSQKLIQSILDFGFQKSSVLVKELINKSTSENMNSEPSPSTKELSPEALIWSEIDSLRKKVVEDCQITLKGKLNFSNKEAYTKFDKFVSNAIISDQIDTEWQDFYRDEKNRELWPGAKSKENAKKLEQDWQDLVAKAITANGDDGLLLPQG